MMMEGSGWSIKLTDPTDQGPEHFWGWIFVHGAVMPVQYSVELKISNINVKPHEVETSRHS
jgi:hypothetical protein